MNRHVNMRRITLITVCAAFALLFCFWQFQLRTPSALAQSQGYTEADLAGVWIVQWTGNVVWPKGSPAEILNGPWAENQRIVLDGAGSGFANSIACFNGQIFRITYQGSYQTARDGRVKFAVVGEAPGLNKIAVEFEGVICDSGNEIRVILTRHLAPGVPEGFTGIVATGVFRRQR